MGASRDVNVAASLIRMIADDYQGHGCTLVNGSRGTARDAAAGRGFAGADNTTIIDMDETEAQLISLPCT
jgi:hypothetical protein